MAIGRRASLRSGRGATRAAIARAGLAAFILLASPRPSGASERALLSFVGLPVAVGDYVSGFHVRTSNVQVLAVCQIPDGWMITAASQVGSSGALNGHADLGVAFVQGRHPAEFKGLFLIDLDPPRPSTGAPFEGSISVGRYGVDAKETEVPLKAASYRLTPARRCPTP